MNISVWVVAVPATKVRVTLNLPPFSLVGITYNYPVTGYPNAEFDLGGCEAGLYPLMTYSVYMINPGCAQWAPLSAEIDACTGETFAAEILPTEFGVSGCSNFVDACPGVVPYNLSPANGAVDVPLDAELSWSPAGPPYVDCWVVINTEPSCEGGLQFFVPCEDPRFSPDFLLPGTTYYWYAAYFETGSGCAIGGGAASTMHHFTTSGSVAVEPSTWGAIKASYVK